jgi:hypothetical protein
VIALAVLVAVLDAAGGSSPVGRRCTKMGCEDQVTVRLRSSDGPPRRGVVIELQLDGKTVSCTVDDQRSEARPCDDQTVTITHQEIQQCRAAGCRGTGRFEELIEIVATPRRLRVRVEQGEQLLGETSFLAHYTHVRPNGSGCSPVCRQATRIWQYR